MPEYITKEQLPEVGLIWDYELGKFVKATREQLWEREQFYKQFPEIAPLGTPGKVTPEQFEQQLADLIENMYPGRGMTIESVAAWVQEDPDLFMQDMLAKGRTADTEALLMYFGFNEADITEIYGVPQDLDTLLARVFAIAGKEEATARLIERIKADIDAFLSAIQAMGQTPDTEAILQAFYEVTPQDIKEFFRQPLEAVAVTEEGAVQSKGFLGELWNSILTGGRHLLHTTTQYFVSTFPNAFYKDVKPGENVIRDIQTGLPMTVTYTAEEAARLNAHNKVMRDKFRAIYSANEIKQEEWLEKHKDLQPPPNYLESPLDNPELWKDPGWWGWAMGTSAAFSVAIIGTTLGVTYLTKNPYAGIASGMIFATPAASQDLYEELRDAGAPEDEAAEIAVPVGMFMGFLEGIGNLPLFAAVWRGTKVLGDTIRRETIRGVVSRLLKKGVWVGIQELTSETLTEVAQQTTQNAFVKVFDENREIFQDIDTTVIRTLIATLPFAIFGGGMSMRQVSTREATTVSPEQKMAEGWERDRHTGEWYKPERLTDIYNEEVARLKEQGLADEQARLSALNEAARRTEGARAIEEAARKIKEVPVIPEAVPEVKPRRVTEAEEIALRIDTLQAELEGLREWLSTEPATKLVNLIKRTGWHKGEVSNLTIPAYKKITGKTPSPTSLTKDKKHVKWEYALDDIATEMGYKSGEDLKYAVESAGRSLTRIKELESEIAGLKVPIEPMTSLPEPTAKEIATNLAITGQPTLTPAQVEKTLTLFGLYLADPSTANAWELTRELRRETLAGRVENLKDRTQELIVEGLSTEEAIKQATRETMSGELPIARTDYLSDLTGEMRDALFNKVYQTLKDEPFEMMSTTEALTNALLGRAIPREPGVRGGSAYTRLQRVFTPEVFKAIKKATEQGKSLQDVIEGLYEVVGQPPIPVDQKTADYLRGLSSDVIYTPTVFLEPRAPTPPHEPPIEGAIKQMPMFPRPARDNIIRVLKEIGWSPIDIGNFLRANKASFDFSFWRQQGPMIVNHPISFAQANIESWKATWSQKAAEASWERITRDPLFHIYSQIGVDFLRPLELPKGTSQWMGVEEFGYLTGERVIPRLTQKIPWVKFSARGFVTGTNEHNWRIFKNHYEAMLSLNEKIASGEIKLKSGEAFSIEKEMSDFAKMLTDFSQRAQLGHLKGLAPALNSMIFAPRATLGRFLTPRHLVSKNPRVRVEAFRNLATFVTGVGGIVLLGAQLGLWEVEKDPRNAEYMSIRIGNIRVDPWAGYRQFLVFYVRIVTGTGVSSVTGAEYPTDPERAMLNFLRGKASPLASIILDFWTGRNFIGEEVDVANKRQWVERISPFSLWDIYESYVLEPSRAAWVILPAILGAGVQAYTGEWLENFAKLGLPKYTENLPYGVALPVYDVKDFWADTSARFKGVDPATLTEDKGFPPYIRAIAEARIIKEHLATLPNEKLVSLNADPAKGPTFVDYYWMWKDREKIVLSGDEEALKAFDADERTRNAHLGNFSQRQFALLNEYWAIIDEDEQAEFLEKHKAEIGVNLRKDWLTSHPKENAQLAIWGQVEVYTQAAYDEARRLIKELDIPDNAVDEYLPPENVAKTHFEYLETGEEFGWNSWETQLLIAQDDAYREWRGLDPIDTPVKALELKVKHRELFDQHDALGDKDSPFYIEDDDDRDEARDKLKADNTEWVDDIRRIEAIEHRAEGFITTGELPKRKWTLAECEKHIKAARESHFPVAGVAIDEWNQKWIDNYDFILKVLDDISEGKANIQELNEAITILIQDIQYDEPLGGWVEKEGLFAKVVEGFKAIVALLNEELASLGGETTWQELVVEAWVERGRLVDEFGGGSSEAKVWLRDHPATWRWALDNGLLTDDGKDWNVPVLRINVEWRKEDDEYDAFETTEVRTAYLNSHPEYHKARRRRDAYTLGFPDDQIETYVEYYTDSKLEKPDDWKYDLWYEDDWWLMSHPEFYESMFELGIWTKRRDFSKVPTRGVFNLYKEWKELALGNVRRAFEAEHPDLDMWLHLKFGTKLETER